MITLTTLLVTLALVAASLLYVRTRPHLSGEQKADLLRVSCAIGGGTGGFLFFLVTLLIRLSTDGGRADILLLVWLVAITMAVAQTVGGYIINRRTAHGRQSPPPVHRAGRVGIILSATGLFGGIPLAAALMLPMFSRFSWLLTYVILAGPAVVLVALLDMSAIAYFQHRLSERLILLLSLVPVALVLTLVGIFALLVG